MRLERSNKIAAHVDGVRPDHDVRSGSLDNTPPVDGKRHPARGILHAASSQAKPQKCSRELLRRRGGGWYAPQHVEKPLLVLGVLACDRVFEVAFMTHTALVAQLQAGPADGWWGVATAVGVLLAIVAWLELMRRSFRENQRLRRQLAVAHEQSQLLATNASTIVLLVDRGGRVRWVSPALTPALGWQADEWLGRDLGDLFSDDAGVFGAAKGSHSLPPQEARPGDGDRVVRTRLRGKSGTEHFAVVRWSPYEAPALGVDGMAVSVRLVDAEEEDRRLLERSARTDELTSLSNRRGALERIRFLDRGSPLRAAVLWCDIDRFKTVNDTYGHAAGDEVLRQLADRIRSSLRSSDDLAARMGGDEIMVVLHGVRTLQDATDVAEKLRRLAAEPIETAAGPIQISLSIGATLASPTETADEVLARADSAMYRAKAAGRNRVVSAAAASSPSPPGLQRHAEPMTREPPHPSRSHERSG